MQTSDTAPSDQGSTDGQSNRPPQRIVGIGASAGGLEALETFFDNMPPDCGLAFVVVQHLSPDFKSLMAGRQAGGDRSGVRRAPREAAPA